MPPPLQCAWQEIALNVVRITDDVGHDWVEHAYPGRAGVEVEAMGKRPGRFEVEVIFLGSTWREDCLNFMVSLSEAFDFAAGEGQQQSFVHPWWGTVRGVATNAQITHEDKKTSSARVTFTFVEAAQAAFAFDVSTTLASAAAAAAAASSSAAAALAALPD